MKSRNKHTFGQNLTAWKDVNLSVRQIKIVKLLSEGLTVGEIAIQLGISNKTVEYHSLNARRKIGSLSIAVLTRFALARGFTSLR